MPRGVKGTGPYSKYKTEGVEVSSVNGATPTETEPKQRRTRKKAAAKTASPRKPRKTTARKATTRRTTTRKATNGHRGRPRTTDLGQLRDVTIESGTLFLTTTSGRAKVELGRPGDLLNLEAEIKGAVNTALASR